MLVIPAIEIHDGACTPLGGLAADDETAQSTDPRVVADGLAAQGFGRLHLLDADAAAGRGSNRDLIRQLLRDPAATLAVGGGVRTLEEVDELLRDGAHRVVLDPRVIDDIDAVAETTHANPGAVVVVVETRDRRVTTRARSRAITRSAVDLVEELGALALDAILIRSATDARVATIDMRLIDDIAEASLVPVFVAGEIDSLGTLRALADRAVAGVVLDTTSLGRNVFLSAIAEEFAE